MWYRNTNTAWICWNLFYTAGGLRRTLIEKCFFWWMHVSQKRGRQQTKRNLGCWTSKWENIRGYEQCRCYEIRGIHKRTCHTPKDFQKWKYFAESYGIVPIHYAFPRIRLLQEAYTFHTSVHLCTCQFELPLIWFPSVQTIRFIVMDQLLGQSTLSIRPFATRFHGILSN